MATSSATAARTALAALAVAVLAACGSDDGDNGDGGMGPDSLSAASALVAAGGDLQTAPAGTTLPVPMAVLARDSSGEPLAEVTVRWEVVSGGGSVAPATVVTDAQGRATTSVTLGPSTGVQQIRAVLDGTEAAPVTFGLTAVPSDAVALVGQVPVPANYGIHDTFVRDGIAFVCAWNTGVIIYDVGNGIRGGAPSRPVEISRIVTSASGVPGGPAVHNAWWFHNPVTGERRYLFVGQEGPGSIGATSLGDIHVVDVSDLARPREVASFHLDGAGTHNFWMDEAAQVLYAAYYNGGVVALDVSGTLTGDLSSRLLANVRPGGADNTYVWGVQLHQGSLYAVDMLSGLWQLAPASGGLAVRGGGDNVPARFGSDLWVQNGYAYTGTWGAFARNGNLGNALEIWRLEPDGAPTLVDSLIVGGIGTVSDVQVSEDGGTLVFSAENGGNAGLYTYGLSTPASPTPRGFARVDTGLHTATLATIGGRLYAFAAKNPASPALMVYDVSR